MSKTTIQNLIIFGIAAMLVVVFVIGGKFLMMEFPDFEGELEFLRIFGSFAVMFAGLILGGVNSGGL